MTRPFTWGIRDQKGILLYNLTLAQATVIQQRFPASAKVQVTHVLIQKFKPVNKINYGYKFVGSRRSH